MATIRCVPESGEPLLNLALAATGAISWHGNRVLVAAGRSWAVIELATAPPTP